MKKALLFITIQIGSLTSIAQISYTPQTLPFFGQVKCVVDMDGDFLDDVVKVSTTYITVAHQTGSGFQANIYPTDTADFTPSWSLAAGDVDGNGYNDLLYGGGGGTSFMIANNNGTSFTQQSGPEYVFSQRTNFIDIDNDGHLDAFVCHDVEPNVYYMNDGNANMIFGQGGIGDTPDGGNYGSLWVDHDNDGDMDVYLAKCRGGDTPANIDQLHRNNGDGTFTNIAPDLGLDDDIQTWSAAWGDYDNDGDMDMMVGAFSLVNGGHKLVRNNGNGTSYTDVTAGSGFDVLTDVSIENVTHDFDNDGLLDIFGAGNVIMMNNGDLTFTPQPVPLTNGPIGDLNNDGFLDIVNNNTVHMAVPNGNNWIKFNTVGTASNYNGIGARIQITSALGTQIREVRSGDGFAFMSSLNVHFGLGPDTEVEEVLIRWPSGTIDILTDQLANTTITVIEGSTSVGVGAIGENTMDLVLYPTPVEDVLNISTSLDLGRSPVWITDVEGRSVVQVPIVSSRVDVSGLNSGMYIVHLRVDGQLVKRKFIKS